MGYGEALRSSDLGLVKSWIASPEGMAEWKQVRIGFTKMAGGNVIHIQCHSFLPFTMFHIQCHGRVEAGCEAILPFQCDKFFR